MRPDRLIVGEVRGGEALDMLQALNTGHDGSLSTMHANGPAEALARLETFLDVQPAPNSFEGHKTLRVYNLLAYDDLWQRVPVHDHVLPIVERVLDPGCLISSLSSIDILWPARRRAARGP